MTPVVGAVEHYGVTANAVFVYFDNHGIGSLFFIADVTPRFYDLVGDFFPDVDFSALRLRLGCHVIKQGAVSVRTGENDRKRFKFNHFAFVFDAK